MKRISLTFILILAGSLAFAQPAPKPDGPGPKMDCGRHPMMSKLDNAQREALMDARKEHQKAVIPLQADLKVARIEYRDLIASGADRKQIDRKQDDIAAIQAKLAKEKTDHLLKVRSIVGEENFKMMQMAAGKNMKMSCGGAADCKAPGKKGKRGRHWFRK